MQTLLFHLIVFAFFASAPAFAGVAVVGSLARHHTAEPGETFEGIILLKNTGAETTDMQISQTDYLFAADGTNQYDKPATQPRSNAGWLSVNPARASVPPQSTVSVYYKGKVPQNAELIGTYWSMIMVEPLVAPLPEIKGQKDKVAMGLQTVMRYAIQVVTGIGETGSEQLSILEKRLVAKDGKNALELDVLNSGEKLQIPSLWAEIFNDAGVSIGRFEGGRWRIYPTCSVRYNVDLMDVPPGKYTALVILDTGGEDVTGAQYSLEIAP